MDTLFDTYIMTDWSASDSPGPAEKRPDAEKKNNIWIGEASTVDGQLQVTETYCRTRHRATAILRERIAAELAAGKRVLAGFDFAFGYPQGFARLLTGKDDWQALWAYLAEHLQDDELNENNRFELAAQINALLPGDGPFWGLPARTEIPHLTPKSPWKGLETLAFDSTQMNRLRITDAQTPGAQEVWKLYGPGSVGGQTLTGIPAVWQLRNAPGIAHHAAIWPFETSMTKKADLAKKPFAVFAEVFPTTIDQQVRALEKAHHDSPRDQLQVRAMVTELHRADQEGKLFEWFFSGTNVPEEIRMEEAAILKPFDAESVAITVPNNKKILDKENVPQNEVQPEAGNNPVANKRAQDSDDRESKRKAKEEARLKAKAEREAKLEAKHLEREARKAELDAKKAELLKEKEAAKAERIAAKEAAKAERAAEKARLKAEQEAAGAADKESLRLRKEEEKAAKKAQREAERAAKKAEREAAKEARKAGEKLKKTAAKKAAKDQAIADKQAAKEEAAAAKAKAKEEAAAAKKAEKERVAAEKAAAKVQAREEAAAAKAKAAAERAAAKKGAPAAVEANDELPDLPEPPKAKMKPAPKAKAKPAPKAEAAVEKTAAISTEVSEELPDLPDPPKAKKKPAPKAKAKAAPKKKVPAKKSAPKAFDALRDVTPDGVNVIEAKKGGPIDPVPSQEKMKEMIESSPEPKAGEEK